MEIMNTFMGAFREAFTEVTSTGAFVDSSVEASMEDIENMKACTGIPFTGASTKASTKASKEVPFTNAFMKDVMEKMKAFADVIEAFTDIPSTEAFVEDSVEASMEDVEDMIDSTEVTSTEASTKASTKASMEETSIKSFHVSFHGSNRSFRGRYGSFH